MARDGAVTRKKTQSFYDRIADVHNFALKLNGYRRSVAKYLRSLDLEVGPDSVVLDAGSGTGIVTMSLLDSGFRPKSVIALDLSFNSLRISWFACLNSPFSVGAVIGLTLLKRLTAFILDRVFKFSVGIVIGLMLLMRLTAF